MINQGTYEIGLIQSFESTPWSSDSSKFNHHIVLLKQRTDRYGNLATSYQRINVSQKAVTEINSYCNANIGQLVMVPIVVNLKKGEGKTGFYAFNDVYMPSDARIINITDMEFENSPELKAVNS
jgi:hypothetical protein